ncbi:PLP-dependent transferase [Aliiglaciecola sp. 2_MG-2023]|uniref:trans-sulfuration enzyme family protein n=1 Tax=unclassified Aliiglaciecola TaxID=2593648 RepID=UPI0026E35286|nr:MULTISPECIES: PLP-dependent transferase [unclassified Aliiglaciecola]MDO6712468.1 PLP-dependent transferase [Aliiglaciecola sp. 2_MG-2023]MDO6753474.1 PLP-dependent transferase [Aliiglaciecola sp. 1_MG-2023]
MENEQQVNQAKLLSPRRNTTEAVSIDELAQEQLAHFGIEPHSEYGKALFATAKHLYLAQLDVNRLWTITNETLDGLSKENKLAYFNAKKFLSFQIAKILDTLQNPFRATYQSMTQQSGSQVSKSHYPLFDNIPALFSATPVIVRTATYVYACTEWVDDAFHGKEFTHQIYSRLLNPTNISLANAIVDLEAGPYSADYLAWNFNSGMAAIDALLSNVLSHSDILIVSRNVYGGVYQLLHDYFARENRMNIQLEWFDGYSAEEFSDFIKQVKSKHKISLKTQNLHVYLESPCNPHGYVLDVAGICEIAHRENHLVMLDATLATPILHQPLQQKDKSKRPDYVVHSYTKDICGTGATTAGVVIGEGFRMFQPKGSCVNGVDWSRTMFWDVYYIKGAFLDSEKAFDVLSGMKTLEQRIMNKVINTQVFSRFLEAHPLFNVNSHALPNHPNAELRKNQMRHGWPCALFTIDLEKAGLTREAFVRFFDALEPAFSHQVSIGQNNTIILCPALTSHSELSTAEQQKGGIHPTTMRIAMGTDNVKQLMAHLINSAKLHIDPCIANFSQQFMSLEEIDKLYMEICMQVCQQHYGSGPKMHGLVHQEMPK